MILVIGFILMGGAVLTKYSPLFDPGPRADVSHLIRLALGETDPPLPPGDSVLSTKGVALAAASGETAPGAPGLARRLYSGPWGSVGEAAVESQPMEWALQAATRDPAALRAWLGWAVMPVATTDGDTVRLRMYRLRLRSGCPMIDRIEAALTRSTGSWETRIVRVEGGCWE
jgi:hypothetical protein